MLKCGESTMHRALVDVTVIKTIQERRNSGRDPTIDNIADLTGRRRLDVRLVLDSFQWRRFRRRRCSFKASFLRVCINLGYLRSLSGVKSSPESSSTMSYFSFVNREQNEQRVSIYS